MRTNPASSSRQRRSSTSAWSSTRPITGVGSAGLDALKSSVDQIEGDIDAQIALAAKAGFDMSALQRDVRALPQMIAVYQERNGDMNRIRDKVASIQKHIDAGELETAYEEVQALKPILASR